jgi:hypothetical protein
VATNQLEGADFFGPENGVDGAGIEVENNA